MIVLHSMQCMSHIFSTKNCLAKKKKKNSNTAFYFSCYEDAYNLYLHLVAYCLYWTLSTDITLYVVHSSLSLGITDLASCHVCDIVAPNNQNNQKFFQPVDKYWKC